jgi:hypothetical protein
MVHLGLQLTLRSGREALVRALMIAVAVAVGVTVLLGVFADYHAYQATSNRACWECTQATVGSASSSTSELWNYSENIYKGRFVEVLDVAGLGPKAPVVPGLRELPAAGQYYASPALADLIRVGARGRAGGPFPGFRGREDRLPSAVGAERTGGHRGVPDRRARRPARYHHRRPHRHGPGRRGYDGHIPRGVLDRRRSWCFSPC